MKKKGIVKDSEMNRKEFQKKAAIHRYMEQYQDCLDSKGVMEMARKKRSTKKENGSRVEEHETRSREEILVAENEFVDRVWYSRHMHLRREIEGGLDECEPSIWSQALLAANEIEEKYGKGQLLPKDQFEWGMINGKLSALRWVLGDEWDNLDT